MDRGRCGPLVEARNAPWSEGCRYYETTCSVTRSENAVSREYTPG